MLLTACQPKQPKSEVVWCIPTVVARPLPPDFEEYDTKKGLDSASNFKKFQRNTVRHAQYQEALNETIDAYEKQIADFTVAKHKFEHPDTNKSK